MEVNVLRDRCYDWTDQVCPPLVSAMVHGLAFCLLAADCGHVVLPLPYLVL